MPTNDSQAPTRTDTAVASMPFLEASAWQEDVALPPLRVLVADDDPVTLSLVAGMLTRRGHQVVGVGNGRDAVAAARQSKFDVVLMDLLMPEMDGRDATRQIRSDAAPGLPAVPIIAMTASRLAKDYCRCLAAGMSDCVVKPVRPNELLAVIAYSLDGTGKEKGARL